jgi:hypothetical protein
MLETEALAAMTGGFSIASMMLHKAGWGWRMDEYQRAFMEQPVQMSLCAIPLNCFIYWLAKFTIANGF